MKRVDTSMGRIVKVIRSHVLLPAAYAFGGLAALRQRAYQYGWPRAHRLAVPLVSVGGIAAGGTGKTPVTRFLADHFLQQGFSVGVVHGGYRGQERRKVQRLTASVRWEPGGAVRFGDEAVMLAGWLPQAMVICGQDKVAAARHAMELGAQRIVVDDAFQHLRLYRDLDIVVDDPRLPLIPLPAGEGRELASARRRAGLLWVHWRDGELARHCQLQSSRESSPPWVISKNVPRSLVDAQGEDLGAASQLAGQRVFLMAGIARPHAFLQIVKNLGAQIEGQVFVSDHRPFQRRHFRRAARSRADLVLCTEKDQARMMGDYQARSLVALRCDVHLIAGRERLKRTLNGASEASGFDRFRS